MNCAISNFYETNQKNNVTAVLHYDEINHESNVLLAVLHDILQLGCSCNLSPIKVRTSLKLNDLIFITSFQLNISVALFNSELFHKHLLT